MDNINHTQWTDPIVAETRKHRDAYAREHNYNMDAIFEDIKRRQSESGRKLVSRSPRKPKRFDL